MTQAPFSRPQPQFQIRFMDPWEFKLVSGWILVTSQEEHDSSQYHWIKFGLQGKRGLDQ